MLGRIDDVMNVSGHRISTAEVESALSATPGGRGRRSRASDAHTGQAICAFVILRSTTAICRPPTWSRSCAPRSPRRSPRSPNPGRSTWCPELPKTRSGKIMRRLLRDVAEGRELGDTSTLLDPTVFHAIRASKAN